MNANNPRDFDFKGTLARLQVMIFLLLIEEATTAGPTPTTDNDYTTTGSPILVTIITMTTDLCHYFDGESFEVLKEL
jgi:hypothetical protein